MRRPSEIPLFPISTLHFLLCSYSEIRNRIAVLSGPNLAGELVRRVPSTTVVASEDGALAEARTAALFKKPTAFFEDIINKGRTAMAALP